MKRVLPHKKATRIASPLKAVRDVGARIADAVDEWRWDRSFAKSQDALQRLGDEALAEYLAGKTEPLDPDTL